MSIENRIKVNDKDADKMTPEELVEDYASLKSGGDEMASRMKIIRPKLEVALKDIKSLTTSTGAVVELTVRNNREVQTDAVEKLCSKKNVEIGIVSTRIVSRGGKIPQKLLNDLDKYFVLEKVREIGAKDIENAERSGLITKKEAEKLITLKPVIALKATLDEKGSKTLHAKP